MDEKTLGAGLAAAQAIPEVAESVPASLPAIRYFDAMDELSARECEIEEKLLAAFGIDVHATPWQPWPFNGFVFDSYDSSFELRNVKDDAWFPTEEHLRAVFALGFSNGWVVYNDQTERVYSPKHLTSERRAVSHQRVASDSETVWKLRKQLAALKASTEVSSTPAASSAQKD